MLRLGWNKIMGHKIIMSTNLYCSKYLVFLNSEKCEEKTGHKMHEDVKMVNAAVLT